MKRLTKKQKEEWRDYLWGKQKGLCALCGTYISRENEKGNDEAVLDHDHETGHIRSVLHRSCNASEGSILQFADKRCRSEDPKLFLITMVKYWEADYSHLPFHPGHKLPEEDERLKLKRKLKKLKSPKHIQKTKDRIKELDELVKALKEEVPSPEDWFKNIVN